VQEKSKSITKTAVAGKTIILNFMVALVYMVLRDH